MMSSMLSVDRSGKRRSSKRARLSRIDPVPTGPDRLSDLPKHLAHQIMSFLPNKECIRMGAVSKHFLDAWRSFPIVDIDFLPFTLKSRKLPEIRRRFSKYALNALTRRALTTDLQRFALSCCCLDESDLFSLVLVWKVSVFAVENKVRELILDFDSSRLPGLALQLFSSPFITKLELSGFFLTPSNNSLVLSCPKVEEFKLLNCTMEERTKAYVTLASPRLRSAHIDLKSAPSVEMLIIESSRKSLESLTHAGRCQISNLSECRLITTLELHHVQITNDWFKCQLCSMPKLRSLTMKHCNGPEKFVLLRNKTLEVLDMEECIGIEEFEMVAENLRVLRFWSVGNEMECYMNFEECFNLREVILRGAGLTVTSHWVASTVYRFELLEKLVLSHCNLIEEVILTAPHLKVLELINCVDLRSFDIEARNLESIVIDGKLDFDSPLIFRAHRAHLDMRFKYFNKNSFENLVGILPRLATCRSVTLSCYRDERFIFPMEGRKKVCSPMHKLLRLEINVVVKKFPTIDLIDSMLWLCPHPMDLRVSINKRPHVILKFHYSAAAAVVPCKAKESLYCNASRIQCWRHFVTRVEVETFPSFTDPWETVEEFFRSRAKLPIVVARKPKK